MWADQPKRLEHEIGHFEPQKNQKSSLKIRVSIGPRAGDQGKIRKFRRPISELKHLLDAQKGIIIMWADQRKRLEHERGHFEPQKNQKSSRKIRVSIGPRAGDQGKIRKF